MVTTARPHAAPRLGLLLGAWLLSGLPVAAQAPAKFEPPPDGTWVANAIVEPKKAISEEGLGAAQGVSLLDGRLYIYGDVRTPAPRVGVIREYGLNLEPTGRVVWLRRLGKPLILHPTGLTRDRRWGTFLGDTVDKKARIYRLDWERAWQDGNLDRAVIDEIDDDAAVNGCRPTFVTLSGRTMLATADYGDVRPEIRLYDPDRLLATHRSSAHGVVVDRVLCGPFNQNLYWDAEAGRLLCIQNVIEGRGWQVDQLDLDRAVADGRASGPGVRLGTWTFPPHDELEGFLPIEGRLALFVTSSRRSNILLGTITPIEPRPSPPESSDRAN